MATANSDLLASIAQSASAGIAGGAAQNRSVVDGAHQQTKVAHFTIPASGAGSAASDVINICTLTPFSRIISVTVFHGAMGSVNTLDIGKVDPNNSSNTDAVHYASGVDTSLAGSFQAGGQNIGEQVGSDPTGAVTDTGNAIPTFGSANVIITATIHGTPTAAQVYSFIIEYAERP